MTDFEMLVAPHRVARRMALPARHDAAVDWAKTQLEREMPSSEAIVKKLRAGKSLSSEETEFIIAALEQKPKGAGRPKTERGRNLSLRFLVSSTAREFNLFRTRNSEPGKRREDGKHYSAADAVAEAMQRIGMAPRGHDRVRKICEAAKPEELEIVRACFLKLEEEQAAMAQAMRRLLSLPNVS